MPTEVANAVRVIILMRALAAPLVVGACSVTPEDPADAFATMSAASASADDGDGDDEAADEVAGSETGEAPDPPSMDDGPAGEGTSHGPGTTPTDDGTTDGQDEPGADCMAIADAATCLATVGCQWLGDEMAGACIDGSPDASDTGFGESGFGESGFGESGFGDFCELFDMTTCTQTMFCVWNAGAGVCEAP